MNKIYYGHALRFLMPVFLFVSFYTIKEVNQHNEMQEFEVIKEIPGTIQAEIAP